MAPERERINGVMKEDLKEILFSEELIKHRVAELGAQISGDYAGKIPLLIGVLSGSFIFFADILRFIDLKCEVRFLMVSSYGLSSSTKGSVNIAAEIDFEIAGRDVIIVEDILDSGVTISALRDVITKYVPSSLRICVLLDKPARRQIPVEVDYVGFQCPDEFLVGYGLDYAERYRNLPYIASLKPEVYS